MIIFKSVPVSMKGAVMEKFLTEVSLDINETLDDGGFKPCTLFREVVLYTIPNKGEYIALTPDGPLNWAMVTDVVHNIFDNDGVRPAAMIWCSLEKSGLGANNDINVAGLIAEHGWQRC
jgi:hypothetical protein